MKTQEIRRNFINYFKEKGHSHISSSPVFPHDDPTLLFINAGMNQFKDVFLGKSRRDYTKATTSQKCIRVGGKHNDFENVGHTSRHLTFFEMLGNFSFGDYFKKEAIQYAWEVSTQIFGFAPEKIWPTVYYKDDEAFELWKAYVPESRITRFGEEDNFWAMGNTGPCGPCTELFYDRGEKYGKGKTPSEDKDGNRFLEFWNLVFMQYNRTEEGILEPLPKPSVDTGAGIERVVSLIMETDSVFETDVLRGIIKKLEEISDVAYDLKDKEKYPAFRVIADHLRTLSFAIADGIQPSNVDRGYVLRKVLRRAVRYGRMLGMDKPFLAQLLPKLIELMGPDYPELIKSKDRIEEILTIEEEAFLRTLQRGGNILNQIIFNAKKHKKIISGEEAFKLKDTYGLPLDEIQLLAKDAGLSVDIEHYKILEEEAKQKSRQAHKTVKQSMSENLFIDFIDKEGPTLFLGYDHTKSQSKVTAIIIENKFVDSISEGVNGTLILNQTPFYAEMGGQIGDKGIIATDSALFEVTECQAPFKGIIAHTGIVKKGKIFLGDTLTTSINEEHRSKIANNHTATHLLHWALHKVLGEHIKQAGSVVDSQRLRFDFSHHKSLSHEEIREIERLVNKKIRDNTPVSCYELKYEEVQKREDIKQFFGDKYDATVRVIDIHDFSKELCGGTHTSATGNIGLFRIAKESSIAAGIRRIEAVTGEAAEEIAYQNEDLIASIAEQLKSQPLKIQEKIEKVLDDNKMLSQELKSAKKRENDILIGDIINKKESLDGISFLALEMQLEVKELNSFGEALAEKVGNSVLILATTPDKDKCNLIIKVSPDAITKGIKAGDLVKKIAPIIGGSGGGKADSAQAGGKFPDKLKDAFSEAKNYLIEILGS